MLQKRQKKESWLSGRPAVLFTRAAAKGGEERMFFEYQQCQKITACKVKKK